jgi:hypothetical protein
MSLAMNQEGMKRFQYKDNDALLKELPLMGLEWRVIRMLLREKRMTNMRI